jgi:hypothetical protein
MSPTELRVAIDHLGLTQEGLADAICIGRRTMRHYVAHDTPVPAPTAILIRIMVARRNWNDLLTIGYGNGGARS